MAKPLTEATLEIIEATAPVVAAHADQIVPSMYKRLLAAPKSGRFSTCPISTGTLHSTRRWQER